MAKNGKLPRRSAQGDVDRLISWYDRKRPGAGVVIEVRLTPEVLKRFARHEDGRIWLYRGRKLLQVSP